MYLPGFARWPGPLHSHILTLALCSLLLPCHSSASSFPQGPLGACSFDCPFVHFSSLSPTPRNSPVCAVVPPLSSKFLFPQNKINRKIHHQHDIDSHWRLGTTGSCHPEPTNTDLQVEPAWTAWGHSPCPPAPPPPLLYLSLSFKSLSSFLLCPSMPPSKTTLDL